MKKPSRNDPCHCGSGKKFKKCCEGKMMRGRFLAAPISAASSPLLQERSLDLGALFQSCVMQPRLVEPLPALEEAVTPEQQSPEMGLPPETLEGKGDILVSS